MHKLNKYRVEIEQIDEHIISLFEKRMELSKEIGTYKKENNLPITDLNREQELIKKNLNKLNNKELEKYYLDLLNKIIELSKEYQKDCNK